jgi:hypothetical protein
MKRGEGLFRVLTVVLVIGFTLSPTVAGATVRATDGDNCMIVAFTSDGHGQHHSLIQSGSVQFGTQLSIETDCPGAFNLTITSPEKPPAIIEVNSMMLTIPIGADTNAIMLAGDGWNITYDSLTFYDTGTFHEMVLSYDEQPIQDGDYWTLSNLRSHEVWVSLVAIVLTWVGTITVCHQIARWWVERHLVEEVI